jgi:class 3 adenylate cyclase
VPSGSSQPVKECGRRRPALLRRGAGLSTGPRSTITPAGLLVLLPDLERFNEIRQRLPPGVIVALAVGFFYRLIKAGSRGSLVARYTSSCGASRSASGSS